MCDLVAALLAFALAIVALLLLIALQLHRGRRERARRAARERGRAIVAELPAGPDLTLFTEDPDRFYYGEDTIEKARIDAVRLLVNGAPIAVCVSRRAEGARPPPQPTFADRSDGIERDRWDVSIETADGAVIVPCGAIRERVSQELARRIFDAVKRSVEMRNAE